MEKQYEANPQNNIETSASITNHDQNNQAAQHHEECKQDSELISNLNRRSFIEKDPEAAEVESSFRRSQQSKLKYRMLKQRLISLTFKHEEFSLGKQATSCSKPRLMKLSIELERQVNNQVKGYSLIDNILKEIFKILEHRRQNDLHVLRQSRFLPSLMQFFKKIVSSHKSQYRECFKILDTAMRILHIFCTISVNRECLILTNRLQTLMSILNWSFSKKQEIFGNNFIVNLLSIVTLLLDHRFETEFSSIIKDTVQFALYSQLIRRMKLLLQSQMQEECITNQTLVKGILRFFSSLVSQLDPSCGQRPINEMSTKISHNTIMTIESTLIYLTQFTGLLLFEKDSTLRQMYLSRTQLATLLHIISIFSTCSKISLALVQRIAITNQEYWHSLRHIVAHCKEHYNQTKDIRDLLELTIIYIGYLSFESVDVQNKVHESGILHEICNLPTNFVVDKKCVEVLMPTLCCLVYKNDNNFRFVFEEMSSFHMRKFLKSELQQLPEDPSLVLSRKFSQSSLTSQNTQCSSMAFDQDNGSRLSLRLRFPAELWRPLYQSLERIE